MRRLLVSTLIVLLVAAAVPQAADDLVLTRFSDYLESLRTQAGIPGLSVTLVRPSPDGTWEKGFGLQDVERNITVRPDTPFHADGVAQTLVATIVLRCVEDGRVSLNDPIGNYAPAAPDPGATIGQLLTHTSSGAGAPVFFYKTERLDPLASVVAKCTGKTFREGVSDLLDRLAMVDSIPGPDAVKVVPPAEGVTPAAIARYTDILARLARPYAVDTKGRSTPSQYPQATLTPASGLVTTARDLAKFDAALRRGVLLQADTLAQAWTPPADATGQRLPHGLGWFVQTYNGERIVWQFGVSDNASSSLVITVPARGMTLILLANSQGLVRPFALSAGDVTVSPFAKLFLSIFLR